MNSMSSQVVQMVFPQNYSNVFACVTKNEIRIYNTTTQAELLQIKLESTVEDFKQANCVEFMADGKSIVSGWTDGKIRAFTP